MKLFALENCTACQGASSQVGSTDGQAIGGKFTYDKGDGIKDKIVISGPLSKVIREALGQIFVKKSVVYSDDASNADEALDAAAENKSIATESQAQDVYIASMIKYAKDNPAASVVLADFDYEAHEQHVEAVEDGVALPQSQRDPAIIPMYVARAEDLTRPDIFDQLHEAEDLNVVVVYGVDTAVGDDTVRDVNYIATGAGIAHALHGHSDHVISNNDPESNLIKAAALERFYEGTKVRLFFGMESFMQELIAYHGTKKAKTP